jgi:Spy/CpxP family protein refolding chaperone
MAHDDTILDQLLRIHAALEGLPTRERLDVVQIAWLTTASRARTEALITPGGFSEERSRQVEYLNAMAKLVAADEPDLEMERLYNEGDVEGVLRRVRRLRADGEKGGA